MKNDSSTKNQENALLWFINVLAGGLILFFLVIHFIINHLIAPGGLLTFSDVVKYYQNPMVLIMEGCFLTFILVHALLGLRSILLDLNPSDRIVRVQNITLIILGIAAEFYGIWILVAVSSMSALP
jgi:succinate dehydrogenase hydrophobic anchor subunit